jgi:hypothetical protein
VRTPTSSCRRLPSMTRLSRPWPALFPSYRRCFHSLVFLVVFCCDYI